jgi:transcriptional regulator with GAF, ATPase, and Fis domain
LRLNCSSLSETLLESELFGHERGAFTGANQTRAGLFENANGGTVFLDEVGELPLGLQARLLRVIEDRKVRRVGASGERSVDVRFIAATNRDLANEVNAGRFRRDLYYRLSAATLVIPPLRERRREIVPLASRFLTEESARLGRQGTQFAPDAVQWLEQQPWPGNIRELRNAVQRAVLLTSGNVIALEHLRGADMAALASGFVPNVVREPPSTRSSPSSSTSPDEENIASTPANLRGAVDAAEREQIVAALTATGGNQTAAAKRLGIGRRTLIDKMIKLGIPRGRKT